MRIHLYILLFLFIGCTKPLSPIKHSVPDASILVLKLEGVIFDKSVFLEDLNKYIKDKKIKGVLIRLNSPGGGLATTQEIYNEIRRLKDQYKKPVVVSIGSVAASGGFYVAMAGDKIVANEGSILGSIGVVMFLANYEKLYDWAKIEHHVIKTGEFKDSGSSFRQMTNRERDYFQDLLDQALGQFKAVIVRDRKLSTELVDEYSDARIFFGDTGVLQGFIDQIGTYYEALDLVGEMSGLGKDPEIFEPPKKIDHWTDWLSLSVLKNFFPFNYLEPKIRPLILNSKWQGLPIYLMPEFVGF